MHGPQGLADPPFAGSVGMSEESQTRAPSRQAAAGRQATAGGVQAVVTTGTVAAARGRTAAFGASAAADGGVRKAYRNMW